MKGSSRSAARPISPNPGVAWEATPEARPVRAFVMSAPAAPARLRLGTGTIPAGYIPMGDDPNHCDRLQRGGLKEFEPCHCDHKGAGGSDRSSNWPAFLRP